MGEELHVWGDRGRRERAKGSVKFSEDVTSEGKALAHVHTQTRLSHRTTGDASAVCTLPVAIQQVSGKHPFSVRKKAIRKIHVINL